MTNKSILQRAQANKNDEFYTRIEDIEQELYYYRDHFRGKTVYLNCDNPYRSDFFKYFTLNFDFLGLRKLICTNYSSDDLVDNDGNRINEKAYKAVVTKIEDFTGDGQITFDDVLKSLEDGENEIVELEGDGDFRSEECVELLKEADIVVTNPPFSLYREYVKQLIEYDKKFLIIGNYNSITYREIFPYIKNNEMWIGYSPRSMSFKTQEKDVYKVVNSAWFTNLDIEKRHISMTLAKRYTPEEYPKYDNYDAIEVSKVSHIPYNYEGVMGVPITFFTQYNPEQFEIVGCSSSIYLAGIESRHPSESFMKVWEKKRVTESKPSRRLPCYITPDGRAKVNYHRLFIRNKHPEI